MPRQTPNYSECALDCCSPGAANRFAGVERGNVNGHLGLTPRGKKDTVPASKKAIVPVRTKAASVDLEIFAGQHMPRDYPA
jgi:hypothetical protein